MIEKRVRKLEYQSTEIIQYEEHKENRLKKNYRASRTQGNTSKGLTCMYLKF